MEQNQVTQTPDADCIQWAPPVEVNSIVRVRTRKYLVEEVIPPVEPGQDTLVRLSCLEDDAPGEALQVLWEKEIDARPEDGQILNQVQGFDPPALFSAYLHALRWNCVTATSSELFQAPYRAGIEVKYYQLEPLRKALKLPRVNLFIADDVGLGKTIEAGLILRELMMRQRVHRVVVACPPSVVRQWAEELESRFGLTFMVYDRDFIKNARREHGFGINPWATHHHFIISHALLRDENHAGNLRNWLGDFCPGALLILDEAHHAAPAAGNRYAVDSKFTRIARDIAPRFEHKLFLSATPHNGHSNSFSALLELLDPQRFCRGVPPDHHLLDQVMVRRLKSDLRIVSRSHDFPIRVVEAINIQDLPQQAPELELSSLLQAYGELRSERFSQASRGDQATAMLVVTSLQKRLMSSIDAFAHTLEVHQRTVARRVTRLAPARSCDLLIGSIDGDSERADQPEADICLEEQQQVEAASSTPGQLALPSAEETSLLQQMTRIAEAARHQPDRRVLYLCDWIRTHMCPQVGSRAAQWNQRRVVIFTEYIHTRDYLKKQLQSFIAHSDQAQERIGSYHGGLDEETREELKQAFNSDPAEHPLRILIATDAAREGVNLQNHCHDLFHFDIPWNPSRMEQRNGRIDRKLQRAPQVNCAYFVFRQRVEDRVLATLVQKTQTILAELGVMSPVLDNSLELLTRKGIAHSKEQQLTRTIQDQQGADDLEQARQQQQALPRQNLLRKQEEELRMLLDKARTWLNFDEDHLRLTISSALQLLGAGPLEPHPQQEPGRKSWLIQPLDQKLGRSWTRAMDSLRPPLTRKQERENNGKTSSIYQWRRDNPPRPIVFRDSGNLDNKQAHLHLEHQLVQRLFRYFTGQGFADHQLNRAAICKVDHALHRVVLLGRLSIYGPGAARLHDQLFSVAAIWSPPEFRTGRLEPLEGDGRDVMLDLENALKQDLTWEPDRELERELLAAVKGDRQELQGPLEKEGRRLLRKASGELASRGKNEAEAMVRILNGQKERILKQIQTVETNLQGSFDFMVEGEQQQLRSERNHWNQRLVKIEEELVSEPERIRQSYVARTHRIELIGLVYLWSING